LQRGLEWRGIDVARAEQTRVEMKAAYRALLKTVDVLLTPTTVVNPITLDELRDEMTLPPTDPMSRRTRFSSPINLIGYTAVAAPCGFTEDGLPIGMQLVGRPLDEATLLAVAERYERGAGWTERHPNL
jgi:aspartyl-tRNA(Asn)/glutamyl-tRNA(Gln) amidotransferase subunit A